MPFEEEIVFPDKNGFSGGVLDNYLAAGFYRIQYFMFTTGNTQIDIDADPLPVFWLRTRVSEIRSSDTPASIRNRCLRFSVACKPAHITVETEDLYNLYRNHISFNASDTCSSYLANNYLTNPFDSWMMEIRDENKLIAVGYFDRGHNSLAGILNYYHPAYKKYSLGKYLMLLKIGYALENNIEFYYTGYISTASNKFDYKIFPDVQAMEVFLPEEQQWIPFNSIGKQGLHEYRMNLKT